jgi:type II secretory pathway component PulM
MMERLSSYSAREKMVFGFALIALLGVAVHALLVEPYTQRLSTLKDDLEQGRADFNYLPVDYRRQNLFLVVRWLI